MEKEKPKQDPKKKGYANTKGRFIPLWFVLVSLALLIVPVAILSVAKGAIDQHYWWKFTIQDWSIIYLRGVSVLMRFLPIVFGIYAIFTFGKFDAFERNRRLAIIAVASFATIVLGVYVNYTAIRETNNPTSVHLQTVIHNEYNYHLQDTQVGKNTWQRSRGLDVFRCNADDVDCSLVFKTRYHGYYSIGAELLAENSDLYICIWANGYTPSAYLEAIPDKFVEVWEYTHWSDSNSWNTPPVEDHPQCNAESFQ